MFQDLLADHVDRFRFGGTPTNSVSATAHVDTQVATQGGRASFFGRANVVGVANQFTGWCVPVSDNRGLRSQAVLSYAYALSLDCGTPPAISMLMPVLFDRQAAVGLGAGVAVALAPTVDFALSDAISCDWYVEGQNVHCQGRGRILVTPYIDSATVGVTVREFAVGVMIKFIGTNTCNGFISLDARIYDQELPFFQPGK